MACTRYTHTFIWDSSLFQVLYHWLLWLRCEHLLHLCVYQMLVVKLHTGWMWNNSFDVVLHNSFVIMRKRAFDSINLQFNVMSWIYYQLEQNHHHRPSVFPVASIPCASGPGVCYYRSTEIWQNISFPNSNIVSECFWGEESFRCPLCIKPITSRTNKNVSRAIKVSSFNYHAFCYY